ncbi:MAG: ROK family protein [Candidatus Zixiibacteriota bacterium]
MKNTEHYAGIDIGGTNIKFGLVDSEGNILYREQKPTQVEKGPKPLLHLVTNIAENLLLRAAEEELAISWLGVSSPGAVDNKTGVIKGRCPNIPGWVDTPLGEHLSDYLNLPVFVDNDANAMALAELNFGAARRFSSALCITVGTGIGGGIIINRALWRGATFSGGEIGHIVLDSDGPKCKCGNYGCLEVFCSSQAMLDNLKGKNSNGLSEILDDVLSGDIANLNIKKLFSAAKKGDESALEVIEEAAQKLGAGLSGAINLLNPEALILGGGIVEGGAGYLEAVGVVIRERAFPSATENLRILKAELGNDAGFIGAGILGKYKSNNF